MPHAPPAPYSNTHQHVAHTCFQPPPTHKLQHLEAGPSTWHCARAHSTHTPRWSPPLRPLRKLYHKHVKRKSPVMRAASMSSNKQHSYRANTTNSPSTSKKRSRHCLAQEGSAPKTWILTAHTSCWTRQNSSCNMQLLWQGMTFECKPAKFWNPEDPRRPTTPQQKRRRCRFGQILKSPRKPLATASTGREWNRMKILVQHLSSPTWRFLGHDHFGGFSVRDGPSALHGDCDRGGPPDQIDQTSFFFLCLLFLYFLFPRAQTSRAHGDPVLALWAHLSNLVPSHREAPPSDRSDHSDQPVRVHFDAGCTFHCDRHERHTCRDLGDQSTDPPLGIGLHNSYLAPCVDHQKRLFHSDHFLSTHVEHRHVVPVHREIYLACHIHEIAAVESPQAFDLSHLCDLFHRSDRALSDFCHLSLSGHPSYPNGNGMPAMAAVACQVIEMTQTKRKAVEAFQVKQWLFLLSKMSLVWVAIKEKGVGLEVSICLQE